MASIKHVFYSSQQCWFAYLTQILVTVCSGSCLIPSSRRNFQFWPITCNFAHTAPSLRPGCLHLWRCSLYTPLISNAPTSYLIQATHREPTGKRPKSSFSFLQCSARYMFWPRKILHSRPAPSANHPINISSARFTQNLHAKVHLVPPSHSLRRVSRMRRQIVSCKHVARLIPCTLRR